MNKCCTKCIACSSQAGEYVFGKNKFTQDGMVLPNLIDVKKYCYNNEFRNSLHEEVNIGANTFVMGNVGRLTSAKNQSFLLDIFNKFHKVNPNAVLLIVGDGELKESLKYKAQELSLLDNVIFTGTRNDVHRLLSVFDIFLFSSFHEGFGIVAVEAMANGLKCICEENAMVSEIKELQNCILVNGFPADKWCQVININKGKRLVNCPVDIKKLDVSNYPDYIEQMYKV